MTAIAEAERTGKPEDDVAVARQEGGELTFSPNALKVLQHRYLRRDEAGVPIEAPLEMFWRVARALAAADGSYPDGQDCSATAKSFFNLMARREFLPNSPTLMNAGTRLGQLSACFVLPVDDSMSSIFSAVKATALIHQSGGGTGFSFSRLRPAGDTVSSTGGQASGPVSFMQVFDSATNVIKQGGRRRGANMGILRVDHPDIFGFIGCKEQEGTIANFNISVALTDLFVQAFQDDADYALVNPRTREMTERVMAATVFQRIVEHAWGNGEPGIVFLDRMNDFNPTPQLGDYESTNPCGEQVLLPYESCNLGSINLSRLMTADGAIDWGLMERVAKLAVRFMDDVITVNRFPLPEIEEATLRTRKIGLGVMGFADMLIELGIPYDSPDAEAVARKVMEAVNYWSKEASLELAQTRGSFPAFEGSIYSEGRLPISVQEPLEDRGEVQVLSEAPEFDWDDLARRIRHSGIRNATTTTIAPTGSISIIAGVSSGIEPLFALAYRRQHILGGENLPEVNPAFERVARARGFYSEELIRGLTDSGDVSGVDGIPDDIAPVFVTAHRVSPEWHVRMQAAFQAYTDNAVSKTINFPHTASQKDVQGAYLLAHQLGCKGLTIYRDGSRQAQVLNRGLAKESERTSERHQPRARPSITQGSTEKISLGCGRYLYVTINEDANGLCEVFLQMGKGGGCMASHSEAVGRLISLGLRSGVDPAAITRQLKGIRCPSPSWHNGGSVLSCADGIAKALERYMTSDSKAGARLAHGTDARDGGMGPEIGARIRSDEPRIDGGSADDICPECPECGSILETSEGCVVCRLCGYSQCG